MTTNISHEAYATLEYFTDAMKVKLEDNSFKLTKPKLPVEALLHKLSIEVEELQVAMRFETDEEAKWECVDVANFAMLIWKRLDTRQKTVIKEITSAGENKALSEYNAARMRAGLPIKTKEELQASVSEQARRPIPVPFQSTEEETLVRTSVGGHEGRGINDPHFKYNGVYYFAIDFERQGWWTPSAGVEIMMFKHKPTGAIFFEDHHGSRVNKLPIMPPEIKEKLAP